MALALIVGFGPQGAFLERQIAADTAFNRRPYRVKPADGKRTPQRSAPALNSFHRITAFAPMDESGRGGIRLGGASLSR
jgi:hypothetical protein